MKMLETGVPVVAKQLAKAPVSAVAIGRVLASATPDALLAGGTAPVELPGLGVSDHVHAPDVGQRPPPGAGPCADDEIQLALRQPDGPVAREFPRSPASGAEWRGPSTGVRASRRRGWLSAGSLEGSSHATPRDETSGSERGLHPRVAPPRARCARRRRARGRFRHRDQGNDELARAGVSSILVGLPLIEYALDVAVQRIVHAVPGREVKLGSAGSDVRVQGYRAARTNPCDTFRRCGGGGQIASVGRGLRRWRLPGGAGPGAAALRRAGRHRRTPPSAFGPTAPPGIGAGRARTTERGSGRGENR